MCSLLWAPSDCKVKGGGRDILYIPKSLCVVQVNTSGAHLILVSLRLTVEFSNFSLSEGLRCLNVIEVGSAL
jgi:hypothetical protein